MTFVELSTASTPQEPVGRVVWINMATVSWMEMAPEESNGDSGTILHTTDKTVWRVVESISEVLGQMKKKGK